MCDEEANELALRCGRELGRRGSGERVGLAFA